MGWVGACRDWNRPVTPEAAGSSPVDPANFPSKFAHASDSLSRDHARLSVFCPGSPVPSRLLAQSLPFCARSPGALRAAKAHVGRDGARQRRSDERCGCGVAAAWVWARVTAAWGPKVSLRAAARCCAKRVAIGTVGCDAFAASAMACRTSARSRRGAPVIARRAPAEASAARRPDTCSAAPRNGRADPPRPSDPAR